MVVTFISLSCLSLALFLTLLLSFSLKQKESSFLLILPALSRARQMVSTTAISTIPVQFTERGFPYIKFQDLNQRVCSLQQSSSYLPRVWLGIDDEHRLHLNAKTCRQIFGPFMEKVKPVQSGILFSP